MPGSGHVESLASLGAVQPPGIMSDHVCAGGSGEKPCSAEAEPGTQRQALGFLSHFLQVLLGFLGQASQLL